MRPLARSESAHCVDQDPSLRMSASRLVVPASLQGRTSFAVSGPEEPSQMIEIVFSASPEQAVGASGSNPRPVGNRRDLAACAFVNPDVFAFRFVREGPRPGRSGSCGNRDY
jgi:hypothetical protein